MSVLFVALPVALLISVIFVSAFVWQMHSGQFDDLETPPRRILYDDVTKVRPGRTQRLPLKSLNDTRMSEQKSE